MKSRLRWRESGPVSTEWSLTSLAPSSRFNSLELALRPVKGLALVQVVHGYLRVSVFAIDQCSYLDPKIIFASVIPCALHVKDKRK